MERIQVCAFVSEDGSKLSSYGVFLFVFFIHISKIQIYVRSCVHLAVLHDKLNIEQYIQFSIPAKFLDTTDHFLFIGTTDLFQFISLTSSSL